MQDGQWVRATWAQIVGWIGGASGATVNGATVNGEFVTVNGEKVYVNGE
jgi:phage-related minor tail protein